MVSKLSENGIAGFLLANGALSGGGEEYKIRKKLIENNLVEAIVILPQNMFYTTNISVTLWILNNNKTERTVSKGIEDRNYRNRKEEVLFMDLRQKGEPFEKKYIQFNEEHIKKFAKTYHNWQCHPDERHPELFTERSRSVDSGSHTKEQEIKQSVYKDTPEYCYSATKEEISRKDYSLVPSKYIEFINRDENVDFDAKMKDLQKEIGNLLKQEATSKTDLLNVFKELGYDIEL
jgi:type I restriction enzyme M protein